MGTGADEGLLILDDTLEPWDSIYRAKALATFIRLIDFDLTFIGQRSTDGETGSIGPRLANYLNIPCLSIAAIVEIVCGKQMIRTYRRIEGQEMLLESSWPAVGAFEKGMKEPRSFLMLGLKDSRHKIISEEKLSNKIPESTAIASRNDCIKLLKLKRVSDQRKLQMIA